MMLLYWPLAHSQIEIVIDISTSSNTPEAAVAAGFEAMCPQIADLPNEGNTNLQQLQSICTALDSATIEQKEQAYRAMSARSNTTQTSATTKGPGAAPMQLIGKRLAALRKAAENVQSKVSFNAPMYGYPLSDEQIAQVFDQATGGGASADQYSRLSAFVTAMAINSEQHETQTLSGFHGNSTSGVLGVDYRFSDKTFAGIAGRYSKSEIDLNRNAGSMDADDFNATLYSTYFGGQDWYIESTAHYGQGKFDLTRQIEFTLPGVTTDETSTSSTDGSQYGLSLGGGYEWVFKDGAVTELSGGMYYRQTKIDAYSETGAGGLNLRINEQSIDSLQFRLGTQLSKAASFSWGVLLPQINLNWVYEFMQDGEKVQASFISDPTNTNFAFTTDEKDPSYFTIGLGLVSVFPGGFTIYAQGESYLQLDNYSQRVWSLGARWEF
jgi:uncharacterized protein with beta-barrel porin domain